MSAQDAAKSAYISVVLGNMPRLLSQLDRDRNSRTYGCFDRNYWHYKIRDFPSMILQQGALSLALVYKNNFPGNIYFKNEKIREWASACLDFWRDNQLSDGSFNEYYPNEHGYPPTVFSLYSTTETYKLLGLEDDEIISSVLKASKFLSNRIERGASNQEIASIAALYNTYLLTGKKWILDTIEDKLKRILKIQSREGWFPEYGGADLGYLSVSLNYLAEYYRLSRNKSVMPHMKKIIDFVQCFVHPNGTIGSDYGSRNTEYFLPNGLEILNAEYPLAGSVADALIRNNNIVSIDDRYLSHYYLHSYVSAIFNYKPRKNTCVLPCQKKSQRYFNDAGLFEFSNGNYYAILGLSKGGVLKVFRNRRLILSDCGYIINNRGNTYVTNWNDKNYNIRKTKKGFSVSGNFHKVKQYIPSPFKLALLRAFSAVSGETLIPKLKNQLINIDKIAPVRFEREILFSRNEIIIEDHIKSSKKLDKISTTDAFSMRYVPSSKFFQVNDISGLDINRTFRNVKEFRMVKQLDIRKEKIKISLTR